MVKAPHPIEEISARIGWERDRRVRLHGGPDRNGSFSAASLDHTQSNLLDRVLHALAEPLDFPPLAASIVPGDRIAIALDDGVPNAASVIAGAVAALERSGVELPDIAVITTDGETSRAWKNEWVEKSAHVPQIVIHDPEDPANLCLAGAIKRREPLLVNRTIFDADMVLPIGLARPGGCGIYECLFPRFSDVATIQRYRTPGNCASKQCQRDHRQETDEAGWLIGTPLAMQVVPGAGETVAHVLAGEPKAVGRRAHELYREYWSLHSPQRVSLVIATVSGGPQVQRWESVGRALAMAENLLADNGAIAICSNLRRKPGQSLGRLVGNDDLAKIERKISHDHAEDSWPAWQIARALQRGPVYLLSQLDPDTVENMGIAPVADVAEIIRLADRHESFALVEDSQHAVVSVDGE